MVSSGLDEGANGRGGIPKDRLEFRVFAYQMFPQLMVYLNLNEIPIYFSKFRNSSAAIEADRGLGDNSRKIKNRVS
jgi:hypothetical protein